MPATLLRALSRILLYPGALCALIAIPPYFLGLTASDGTPLHAARLTAAIAFFAASLTCKLLAALLPPPRH